jgi:tetratricopeptide (TPR) repeat protein
MFRLLGLHPGPDFTAAAAAALAGVSLAEGDATLELLLDEHLLQQRRGGRYELHDLIRAFALDLVRQDDNAVCESAIRRLTSWYAHSAYHTAQTLRGGAVPPTTPCESEPARIESRDTALAWLYAEETNLEHVIRAAAEAGLHETAWQTSTYLDDHFYESGRFTASIRVSRMGAESARNIGDRSAEGQILCSLGWGYVGLAHLDTAESCMREAVALCEEASSENSKANALTGLGKVLVDQGKYADAFDSHGAALTIYQRLGKRRGVGSTHNNIGAVHFEMKRYDLALASYLRALEILDSPESDSYALVLVLGNIAEVHYLTGHYDAALSYEARRLALARQYGHTQQEAQSLLATGDELSALGRSAEARTAWTEAVALYEQLDTPDAVEALQRFGSVTSGVLADE